MQLDIAQMTFGKGRDSNMDKILMWIAIIIILLSGFSIQINLFKFEWIGLLDIILKNLK